jgi:tetratricopeptide (TPR) repeat protein
VDAIIFHLQGNEMQAIHTYKISYATYHNDLHFIFLGFAYIRAHKYEEAINLVKIHGEENPGHILAPLLNYYINSYQNNWPEALLNLNQSLALDPTMGTIASIWAQRGWIYLHQHKLPEALDNLNVAVLILIIFINQSIQLNVNKAFAWSRRGDIYLQLNNLPEARADFDKA